MSNNVCSCAQAKKFVTDVKQSRGKTINEILRDLEEYNRKNNKCLSYGQYVSLLYMESNKHKRGKNVG